MTVREPTDFDNYLAAMRQEPDGLLAGPRRMPGWIWLVLGHAALVQWLR